MPPTKHTVTDTGFSCYQNDTGTNRCRQCIYILPTTGRRCRLNTCVDLDYCHWHLRKVHNVQIKPSTIIGAGLGVFAAGSVSPRMLAYLKSRESSRAEKNQYAVFKKGDTIGTYKGEEVKYEQLNERYGEHRTAPYAVKNRGKYIDSLCERNFVGYVNSAYRSGLQNNTRLTQGLKLVALRNIYPGEELLWSYGADYWRSETPHIRSTKSASQRRRRGGSSRRRRR